MSIFLKIYYEKNKNKSTQAKLGAISFPLSKPQTKLKAFCNCNRIPLASEPSPILNGSLWPRSRAQPHRILTDPPLQPLPRLERSNPDPLPASNLSGVPIHGRISPSAPLLGRKPHLLHRFCLYLRLYRWRFHRVFLCPQILRTH